MNVNKDNHKTEVIFRREADGQILAVFPYEISDPKGSVTVFTHREQHHQASYDYCVNNCKPAKVNQYSDLFEELESIGYNLKVIKRRSYKKYLAEFNKVR